MATSRAARGHMLIDAALNTIPVEKAYHIPLPTKETDEPKRDTARTDPENDDVETDQHGKLDDLKQTMTTRTTMLFAISGYGIYTPEVHKS